MNIEQFKTESDLTKLFKFIETLPNIKVVEHDWDNMCAIVLTDTVTLSTAAFNFYSDGVFRCIIDPTEEDMTALNKDKLDKEIKRMTLLELVKRWYRLKDN